jgi:formylglycine-generating enzyme required for sulfatase activity
MYEILPLNSAQTDRVVENTSGGAALHAENDIGVGGDVVGRDKIESAAGHIIHAEPGSTVVVNEPLRLPRAFWAVWQQRVAPLIGLVVMASAALLMLLNSRSTSAPADMAYIPAGSFTMGSNLPEAPPDAQPQHTVDLDAYWIDRYEVTNRAYKTFLDATEHRLPLAWEGKYPTGRDEVPVAGVSWADAEAYCNFAGKRLPTEAEWEKAARGTDGRIWPWGNEWDAARANAAGTIAAALKPVGSYLTGVSPYGVYDMAGNVWEWVRDWYEAEYYTLPKWLNPTGPALGEFKVARGGAWTDAPAQTRTFTRLGIYPPDFPGNAVGFRCACTDCRQ